MAHQGLYSRGSWWSFPFPSPTMASFSSGIEAHSSPVEPPQLFNQHIANQFNYSFNSYCDINTNSSVPFEAHSSADHAHLSTYPRGSWWSFPCPSPTMASHSSGIEAHSSPVEHTPCSGQTPCYRNHRNFIFDDNSSTLPVMFGHPPSPHIYEYTALCSPECAAWCDPLDSSALFQPRTGADHRISEAPCDSLCEYPRNYRSITHPIHYRHVSHTDTVVFEPQVLCPDFNLISHDATSGGSNMCIPGTPLHVTECFHDVDHLEALPLIDIEFSHHYFIDYNSNICKYSLLDPSEDMPCCLSTPAGVFPDTTSFTTGLGWLSSIPEGLEQSTVLALCQCSVRVRCSSCSSVLLIEPCECCECGASTFDVVLQCVCECCVHVPGSKVVLDSCPEACCLSSFCVCFDPGQSLT